MRLYPFILFLLFAAFASCEEKGSPYAKDAKTPKYAEEFKAGLRGYNKKVKLVKNYLVSEGDTVMFPEYLALGKDYVLKGSRNDTGYQLTLNRVNLTSLDYSVVINKGDETLGEVEGQAHLHHLFFLGAENYVDERGNGYLADEYSDHKNNCYLKIVLAEENGILVANLWRGECTSPEAVTIQNAPELRSNFK
jgi:hypothetical protein